MVSHIRKPLNDMSNDIYMIVEQKMHFKTCTCAKNFYIILKKSSNLKDYKNVIYGFLKYLIFEVNTLDSKIFLMLLKKVSHQGWIYLIKITVIL